ncbi:MAG: hypothetical protein LBJ46_02520 [Planctomycetota bacterium]|jgi:hypothetical protein|nr:hypothetical protein [Planctomycetota bacterium]
MGDHEVNWRILAPAAILIGFASLALEMARLWPWQGLRPDFLWCLAFHAARRSPARQALGAFFLCGSARDFLIGFRLGSGSLAFLASAWALLALRDFAASGAFVEHVVLAGTAAVVAEALVRFLNAGLAIGGLWTDCLALGVGDGLATLLTLPFMMALLSIPCFRPWKERRWMV